MANNVPYSSNDGDGVNYHGRFQITDAFSTVNDAVNHLNEIAISIGFELVIDSYKQNPTGPLRCYLKCFRGARYSGNKVDPNIMVRPNTSTKFCGCNFMIRLVLGDKWHVSIPNSDYAFHNHAFIVYAEGHRRTSGLNDDARRMVRQMTDAETAPRNIQAAVNEAFPHLHQTIKHIYNERYFYKMEGREERTSAENFLYLALRKTMCIGHYGMMME
ncbi:uncharacterized protein LOC130591780 [Beta vulgaris subsp. vulgaris]|uniref:uncharacterized protein LOC130591780 n=1 Tax=Beta vulgaris subsp. vulgaris TaxID=3555 RepID=UPI002548DA34|nr:uncharacterized protein LOC130591780 [Beta vulgaris subsp. vulgaris]